MSPLLDQLKSFDLRLHPFGNYYLIDCEKAWIAFECRHDISIIEKFAM